MNCRVRAFAYEHRVIDLTAGEKKRSKFKLIYARDKFCFIVRKKKFSELKKVLLTVYVSLRYIRIKSPIKFMKGRKKIFFFLNLIYEK